MVQDHTSRLCGLERSFQETLPIISSIQTLTMSIHEDLQDIKSDVKALRAGHEDLNVRLLTHGNQIGALEVVENGRKDRKKVIKTTILTGLGTIAAAFVIWVLGWK